MNEKSKLSKEELKKVQGGNAGRLPTDPARTRPGKPDVSVDKLSAHDLAKIQGAGGGSHAFPRRGQSADQTS